MYHLDSTDLMTLISELTGLEHADTLRGDANDFHAEAVSLEADAPIRVRAIEEDLELIKGALAEAGYGWAEVGCTPDEDYGDLCLLVQDRPGARRPSVRYLDGHWVPFFE